MRKFFPGLMILVVLTVLVQRPLLAESFFNAIEDLPIMAGLVEDTTTTVNFDSVNGRYVEVFAIGAINADKIRAFYDATLPQLGWQKSGSGYSRENENLLLEITQKDLTQRVRFILSPLNN